MRLDLNCEVDYLSDFLTQVESIELYNHLSEYSQLTDMMTTNALGPSLSLNFGKMTFLDKELIASGKYHRSHCHNVFEWSGLMSKIKNRIEKLTRHIFQVCVCIYYPDGNSGVLYHSDYPAFGDTSYIPSLSLGEERVFMLREKETEMEHSIVLQNGSLIIMGDYCQERYEHAIPLDPNYRNPRINLTFRKFGPYHNS